MQEKIIEMLNQNSLSARASFSPLHFNINATAPLITVSQPQVKMQKRVVVEENIETEKETTDPQATTPETEVTAVEREITEVEREITLNVYSPKTLGENGAKTTAQKVLALLIPFASALEMGESSFDNKLRHYKTTITLTLYKTDSLFPVAAK